MNITLIGMPGSGKSYIGKKLAESLGYMLVELDKVMEEEFNIPLQSILDKIGEKAFVDEQEKDAILYTAGKENLVVSPGGSIIYSDKAMAHLKSISKIIYLKAPFELIQKRVAEVPRGIVGLKSKTLEDLYKERTVLYAKWASATVDADQDSEKVISDILNLIK